jgi:hypothetical protein
LPRLRDELRAGASTGAGGFKDRWQEAKKGPRPSLARSLLKAYPRYYFAVSLSVSSNIMMGLGALVLKLILEYFEYQADGSTKSLIHGLLLVLLLLLPTLVCSFCLQHSDHVMVQLSIQARAALVAEVTKTPF